MAERTKTNLINFLQEICAPLLDCSRQELLTVLTKRGEDRVRRFIFEQQVAVLVVGKEVVRAEGGKDDSEIVYELFVDTNVSIRAIKSSSLVVLKRPGFSLAPENDEEEKEEAAGAALQQKVGSLTDIGRKLQIMSLGFSDGETSPLELTSTYMEQFFRPLFQVIAANISSSTPEGTDEGSGLLSVQRKLTDLLLAVQQAEQSVEVPIISLTIEPRILEVVSQMEPGAKFDLATAFGPELEDGAFLNQIQAGVSKWVKEIQKVTRISRNAASGSTQQEVNFWLAFEKALFHVEKQLSTVEVETSLALLKHAKRFFATMSFESDAGLKQALENVTSVNIIMKEFPINDLLSATTVEQITTAIRNIFVHLKKLKNANHYPLARAFQLVEALSRDMTERLSKVLSGQRLLQAEYEVFEHDTKACADLFKLWEEEVRLFKEMVRELVKKRGLNERPPPKLLCEHVALQERLVGMGQFRRQHQKLKDVVSKVLVEGREETAVLREVTQAYKIFLVIEPLDVTTSGIEAWETAKRAYDDKIDRAESQITVKLRDRLGAAKTSNEMFKVFSQFNVLFFRPRIRGAIQEYQAVLIQQVKNDLKKLQTKLSGTYERTDNFRLCITRDIPRISGSLVWAAQLQRKLENLMQRVEAVLGRGWEIHMEGKKLKQDMDNFSENLNQNQILDRWLRKLKDAKKLDNSIRIFKVTKHGGKGYVLDINYDISMMDLFKEVRLLQALQLRVPYSVKVLADEAKLIYPYAMRLQEIIRTYSQAVLQIEGFEPSSEYTSGSDIITALVARYESEVQKLITEGCSMRWESERADTFTRTVGEMAYQLDSKVQAAILEVQKVDRQLYMLKTIPFEKASQFLETIEGVQSTIDSMRMDGFSNLYKWIELIEVRVEKILLDRLRELVVLWIKEFSSKSEERKVFIKTRTKHELKVKNQQLYLSPPIESAKQYWTAELMASVNLLCGLPRIALDSTQEYAGLDQNILTSIDMKNNPFQFFCVKNRKFRHLALQLPLPLMSQAHSVIQTTIDDMADYVGTWLSYQSLWDVEPSSVFTLIGDDIENWQRLLNEIKAARKTFDTSETSKEVGEGILIEYSQIQSKVNTKYDAWHREILNAFGLKVAEKNNYFRESLLSLLESLEQDANNSDIQELSSLSDSKIDKYLQCDTDFMRKTLKNMASILDRIQSAAEKEINMAIDLERLRASEQLLERQRYSFPSKWIWIEQLQGEWSKFQKLVKHLASLIQKSRTSLEVSITKYDQHVQTQIKLLYAEWTAVKPVNNTSSANHAISILDTFEKRMEKLNDDYTILTKGRKALGLPDYDDLTLTPDSMKDELISLRGVWAEMKGLHDALAALKDTAWALVVPKKIKTSVEDLVDQIKKIPAKFRQYEAFEDLHENLMEYLKVNSLISEMKTEALKERHWKQMMHKLRVSTPQVDLTLGIIWDADILKKEQTIREILAQAQGELALEEFLRDIKTIWNDYELELVPYQSKCKLIKNWDDIFALIDDHLNALASMKLSPYYRIFEEETVLWEDKLNRFQILLDAWMETQRKWVYLEGVFTGSADISSLLPNEHLRFKAINNDFVSLMKKAVSKAKIVDVTAIEGLQRQLTRLSEQLSKIQKALGEYLEQQRAQFPRFYFVGDEDLLEMIGNTKDVTIVQRHLNKMFAGLTMLELNPEDSNIIIGMGSKEGEIVYFEDEFQIDISKSPSLNAWLTCVEKSMFTSLATKLKNALETVKNFNFSDIFENRTNTTLAEWIKVTPGQIILLSLQIDWTQRMEIILRGKEEIGKKLGSLESFYKCLLFRLAEDVIETESSMTRVKIIQLITEIVHQRDTIREMGRDSVCDLNDFNWLKYLRYYWTSNDGPLHRRLVLKVANAMFYYGFEYLGLTERLVQTPLTDQCYLTLTQALHMRLGGNPFGPAGTGKTETVKSLGVQLGKFVLVFNCDEAFDTNAMGRIFVGLCQVGAWGCFDEFNRLEEKILSAVSEQILNIQIGMKNQKKQIELLNKSIKLNPEVGIFVTMNPGYAGRSNLPDNLKQLFRSIAMINPDKQLIAQVTMFSQGFQTAERLSSKVISLFDLCSRQLSYQPHYDFGLRSLKSVLNSAGNLKRMSLLEEHSTISTDDLEGFEQTLLLRSVSDNLVPKLVSSDVPLLKSLIQGVFPNANIPAIEEKTLCSEIQRLCGLRHFVSEKAWMNKVMQLYSIQKLQHGVMLVGPVSTGKSACWQVLLAALEKVDNVKGQHYIIDAKVISKESLYGRMDSTTLEWTDGIFTCLIRRILYSTHGEKNRRHWIVFDGDVDPEWAENLNSVLDDNKLLTLPNGERLQIPSNVRILFEVDTLKYATLATVSRCGMVWFSDDLVTVHMIFTHYINKLKLGDLDELTHIEEASSALLRTATAAHEYSEFTSYMGDGSRKSFKALSSGLDQNRSERVGLQDDNNVHSAFKKLNSKSGDSPLETQVKKDCMEALKVFFAPNSLVVQSLELVEQFEHIMPFLRIRAIESLFKLLLKGISTCADYATDKKTSCTDHLVSYMKKYLLVAIVWAFGGSLCLSKRLSFCHSFAGLVMGVDMPLELDERTTLLDYEVQIEDAEWHHWREQIKQIDIDRSQVSNANLVIETIDTVRHRNILAGYLEQRSPFILCGPPGSGKTMTLASTLRGGNEYDVASLNFSSGSMPDLLFKTFEHYCEYVKTPAGLVVRPTQPGKWLIVFADEINLPAPDKYGTQKIIMFMRQLTEAGGFWKLVDTSNQWVWVKLEKIQFVGACNPPTDAGRHQMSHRFLRYAPLMFVDFPATESLTQIFGTFNRAILTPLPDLAHLAHALTIAMVDFYSKFSTQFTVDMQPHYIYSPRELTRWKLAMFEALQSAESVTGEELVRLFVHEGLRIFQDRLVEKSERELTDVMMDEIVGEQFGCILRESPDLLRRPLLFSTFMTKDYGEVDREDLREMIKNKLRVFNEEELNIQLVLFDEVVDHITRIDRVLRQPLGHLLIVGSSGAGKTVLSKFVSWLNGLKVFQIKAGRSYNTQSFEADLRYVMKMAGIREEGVTFIFDESNALGPAFLERMNALLASGEVPGLFEGDEYTQLINDCKAVFGVHTDENDIFARFTKQVQKNLHIVFTMNPANPDFSNRQATSPALFNRCVIDWFGDWPQDALKQVALEFTQSLEIPKETFGNSKTKGLVGEESIAQGEENHNAQEQRRAVIANAIVKFHAIVTAANTRLAKNGKQHNYMTPRDYLDFIRHFIQLHEEKKDEVSDQKKHLNVGLQKLKGTEEEVALLKASLSEKEKDLTEKNDLAEKKMHLMVEQQTEAEEKKKQAEILAKDLDEKMLEIEKRKKIVSVELAEVEPLLREAKEAVTNIPKTALDELKALAKPPVLVRTTIEAVVVMIDNMGDKPITYEDARKVVRSTDFISRIVSFVPNSVNLTTRKRVEKMYLSDKDWEIERIFKASKVAGPLAKWVGSSVQFVGIQERVEPLEKEISDLENAKCKSEKMLAEAKELIENLGRTLIQYKQEYAVLITQVEKMKMEIGNVQNKCKRAMSLLANLSQEEKRWSQTCSNLLHQQSTFMGDCILSAAFCTYIGFFEHSDRRRLLSEFTECLEELDIRFRADLSYIEFLSKPSERLTWLANKLPSDDLSAENAIILKRFIRYPLIIDPSGQAGAFITNQYASRKIVSTSFVDVNFLKHLEGSLRFGTTLLIQDVEKIDPILNPVLNQETHKHGGRVQIIVGDSEIDFSPTFSMFLITRDPTTQFTPDLCSRVTFVNFTLTPSSLQNQCLNLTLRMERPDIDNKRSDLLKLQGEFKVKIRELEEALLLALSNVQGNILDDDKVLTTMETLKTQALQVVLESDKTELIINEIDQVSSTYLPIAHAATRIYFSLQHLPSLKPVYQFDIRFFFAALNFALSAESPPGDRSSVLFARLFSEIYTRTSRGLFYEDRLVLALQLAYIKLEVIFEHPIASGEFELLLKGTGCTRTEENAIDLDYNFNVLFGNRLTAEQTKTLLNLANFPSFKNLYQNLDTDLCSSLLDLSAPEEVIPTTLFCLAEESSSDEFATPSWALEDSDVNPVQIQLNLCKALLLKTIRPDRLHAVFTLIVQQILGKNFLQNKDITEETLTDIINTQSLPSTPVFLIASPGFDPSTKILNLAKTLKKNILSIAMGSEEGYSAAESAVGQAGRNGGWIILKNVHLCVNWLQELEKKLYRSQTNDKFRLFLTMEYNTQIPQNLLRLSNTIVFEPPQGLKASLLRTYHTFLSTRTENMTVAQSRLHFLLAVLHGVILERKRYTPVGWTKGYEFSDADQQCALNLIDAWLELAGRGGEHMDPSHVPWAAIRALLGTVIYGGRLDNAVDKRVLTSLVDHLFSEKSFEVEFQLNLSHAPEHLLKAPQLSKSQNPYLVWIQNLPDIDLPTWLGFAPKSERLVSARMGEGVVCRWSSLQLETREALLELSPTKGTKRERSIFLTGLSRRPTKTTASASWLHDLLPRLTSILAALPRDLAELQRTPHSIKDPLFRCFDREISVAHKLLKAMREELSELITMCEGGSKVTNNLRHLAQTASTGRIPPQWRVYTVTAEINLSAWIQDLICRLAHFSLIAQDFCGGEMEEGGRTVLSGLLEEGMPLSRSSIWLGGLFYPEAYLTASRQATSVALQVSIDDLHMHFQIGHTNNINNQNNNHQHYDKNDKNDLHFIIGGLTIQAAVWNSDKQTLELSERMMASLPPTRMEWKLKEENDDEDESFISVPIFLNRSRSELITFVKLPKPKNTSKSIWFQRGVAVFLWSNT